MLRFETGPKYFALLCMEMRNLFRNQLNFSIWNAICIPIHRDQQSLVRGKSKRQSKKVGGTTDVIKSYRGILQVPDDVCRLWLYDDDVVFDFC